MNLSGCKQVTASDVISGWHFSAPLADQIRRDKDPSRFGISAESWARLRWGGRWARKVVRGWSMKAIVNWFGLRKLQDKSPKDKWSVGVPNWYTEHQP